MYMSSKWVKVDGELMFAWPYEITETSWCELTPVAASIVVLLAAYFVSAFWGLAWIHCGTNNPIVESQ